MIMDGVKDLDRNKLTTAEELTAMTLAANDANWAIRNAKTKFTPEQKEKIRGAALRSRLLDALKEAHSTGE